ncbi:hypothetical protein PQC31_gp90 [Pseudomonas phage Iggy]|uniref:Uncharacterized protein n=1 Tax=Pseudomonas phage Iggy TaxID=2592193 RepID=A0A7S5AZR8_9CAUD|nr:hypothetical protein PQC31_gp90 [Pseudomonas phage Iggy]QEA09811.1 hypothetical protein [Pseudomonas phage Iggy]
MFPWEEQNQAHASTYQPKHTSTCIRANQANQGKYQGKVRQKIILFWYV